MRSDRIEKRPDRHMDSRGKEPGPPMGAKKPPGKPDIIRRETSTKRADEWHDPWQR